MTYSQELAARGSFALGLFRRQGLVVVVNEFLVFLDYVFAGAFHDRVSLALSDPAPLGHLLLDVLIGDTGKIGAAGGVGLTGGSLAEIGLGLTLLLAIGLLIGGLGFTRLWRLLLLGLLLV